MKQFICCMLSVILFGSILLCPASATSFDFYYAHNIPELEAFIRSEETRKQLQRSAFSYLIEKYGQADESEIYINYDEITLRYRWDSTTVLAFQNSENKAEYLKQMFYNSLQTVVYFPIYYQENRELCVATFTYKNGEFIDTYISWEQEWCDFLHKETLQKYLVQQGAADHTPIALISEYFWFALTEKDGEYYAVFLPLERYEFLDQTKVEHFTSKPIQTLTELADWRYEMEQTPISNTDGGVVTSVGSWWMWGSLAGCVLAAGIITTALLIRKKHRND